MREYQCHEKCYDSSLWRPGDTRRIEESAFKTKEGDEPLPIVEFLDNHFSLISDDSKPAKPDDPEAAVKAFAKKNKVSKKEQERSSSRPKRWSLMRSCRLLRLPTRSREWFLPMSNYVTTPFLIWENPGLNL